MEPEEGGRIGGGGGGGRPPSCSRLPLYSQKRHSKNPSMHERGRGGLLIAWARERERERGRMGWTLWPCIAGGRGGKFQSREEGEGEKVGGRMMGLPPWI